jgi:hypothetical protein
VPMALVGAQGWQLEIYGAAETRFYR